MKILFQSRTTLFSVPGGDTIQILKTAEAVRAKGHRVDISTELEPALSEYDIVHIFNLMRPQESYLQALNAKSHGKKIALSTIYGPYVEYDTNARGGVGGFLSKFLGHSQLEYLKIIARGIKNQEVNKGTLVYLRFGHRALQKKILELTDVLLPNSEPEMKRVIGDFSFAKCKNYVVVPNAIDIKIFDYEAVTIPEDVERYMGCILCVGRIEGRKNQLNLVRAIKGLPWPLVLIGKAAPNHLYYFEKVKKEAGPNVHILGQVEHNQLAQFYKAAKVHALISWMETPGLSSLEAGAMCCNLVITDKGDTRDYFGENAFYCEPNSVDSIRKAIIKAYESPVNPDLRRHIVHNFNWEKTAEMTLKGYERLLG